MGLSPSSQAGAANAPAGLPVRQLAIARLKSVRDGERFSAFTASEIANGRDRALANRLVTTAIRRHGHLDIVIAQLLERGLPKKSGSFEATLRLGLAQLLFLPDLGAHSAVFLAVEAARRDSRARHLAGLMNAVLRRAQADAEALAHLPTELLIPDFFRMRWTGWYGEAGVAALAHALEDGATLDLTFKDVGEMAGLGADPLFADSGRITLRDRPVEQLDGYSEGRWWVQDAAAAIPARLIQLAPGARVLDACAAPGGKTAQLIKAGYQVTALDSDPARLARLKENLARLNYAAETATGDFTTYRPEKPFDAVLLDAPCTATGTFRRHPEVLWNRNAHDIADRVQLQRRMLANAAECLSPGGTLVYCVCSLEREEGEEQVAWALQNLPLEPFPVAPGETPLPEGALRTDGTLRLHAGLGAEALVGEKPTALDGFFVARLRRG